MKKTSTAQAFRQNNTTSRRVRLPASAVLNALMFGSGDIFKEMPEGVVPLDEDVTIVANSNSAYTPE